MDFYYNERDLMNDATKIIENIKEIKRFYDILKNSGNKLLVKSSFDIPYELIDIRKVVSAIGFIKNIDRFEESDSWLEVDDIIPKSEDCYFIELISACYKNKNNLIVSSINEDVVIEEEYYVKNKELVIINIVGEVKLNEYILMNPIPDSITEVFERASVNFNKVIFTNKAYETGITKNDIYKNFGFDRILNVFKVTQDLLYPFYRGTLNGVTQDSIQDEFKARTGVDFSHESEATLKKYGSERTVSYNGRKIKMSFHIKVKGQGRIYFSYENNEDCILIGHCGGHLKTVNYK